ncbi:MAG: P1 family peptidase [Acidimicrobiia bacterium]
MAGDLVDVPGVRVGHWNHPTEATGCTVVVLPATNEAAVEVRGAAPASRETDLLRPGMSVRRADAVLFAGGSAFGLAAADGVVAGLEADGRGEPTVAGPVPIVPAAAIYDLAGREPTIRPDAAAGRAAYDVASSEPLPSRHVGAGAGATVAKWRGPEAMVPGGIGTASATVGDAVVGALVVANAVGDVVARDGRPLTGGGLGPIAPFWAGGSPPLGTNTTLVLVATNGSGGSIDRLAVRAQDALAALLRPAHSSVDGDLAVVARLSGGPTVDGDHLGEVVFWVVAEALERAVDG